MKDRESMTPTEGSRRESSAELRCAGPWALGLGPCNVALLVLVAVLLLPLRALPHDSPEHVIEMLTARMEMAGQSPNLLWRRATEHRVLGDLVAAASDLKRALKMDHRFLPALIDLSRVQLAQGQRRRALWTIDRAFEFVGDEPGREIGRAHV